MKLFIGVLICLVIDIDGGNAGKGGRSATKSPGPGQAMPPPSNGNIAFYLTYGAVTPDPTKIVGFKTIETLDPPTSTNNLVDQNGMIVGFNCTDPGLYHFTFTAAIRGNDIKKNPYFSMNRFRKPAGNQYGDKKIFGQLKVGDTTASLSIIVRLENYDCLFIQGESPIYTGNYGVDPKVTTFSGYKMY